MKNRRLLSNVLISGFVCSTLSSCGVVVHANIEGKMDDERLATLSSMTDAQLCSGYNNFLVKPKTERDIENILRERKIGRCDARGKIRIIPLDIPSKTDDSLRVANNTVIAAEPKTEASPPSSSAITAPQAQNFASPTSVPASQPKLVFGNNKTLIKDIEAMRKESLTKDGFESSAEYEKRRQRYLDQFKEGKGYRITLDIDNADNKKDKLVYFNPDAEELHIAMPPLDRDLVFVKNGGKSTLKKLHHSFVQIESTDRKINTYKANNRFGASIDVVETAVTRYGVAILSQATKDYAKDFRQTFVTNFKRSEARELLAGGKIVMEVAFDSRYSNIDEANPFLLKYGSNSKPTFERPVDITETRYAVPVRLLKIHLINKTGVEVFSAIGKQVDVEAMTD